MKKIVSLFQRNYDGDRLVRDEIVPGAEWVAAGEGVATRKMDGTCCLVQERRLYKRYDAKQGKTPPEGFMPAQEADPVTGHWPGWLLVGDDPSDKWHREAMQRWLDSGIPIQDGTYELVGPKVQGNPEKREGHGLVYHGGRGLVLDPQPPRDFAGLREYLTGRDIEGIVWHHPDGRMVKIKLKDFGLKRTVPSQRHFRGEAMKARDVYLEAARLVAEERGPACCRIDQAAGRKGAGYSRHAMRFQELFQPTDAEIQEHEVAYPFWLRLRSESYMSKVAQHRRVMAPCFMAAII